MSHFIIPLRFSVKKILKMKIRRRRTILQLVVAVYCFAPISALKEISIHRRKVNTKNYSIHKRKVKNYNIIRKSKHSHRSNVVLFLSLRPIRVTRCKWAEFLSRPVTRLTSFAWHESHTCYVIVACRCLCR